MDSKTCSVDGCERRLLARGYCGTHYARFRASGELQLRERFATCRIDGCDEGPHGHGYCIKHYQTLRNHGGLPTAQQACSFDGCQTPVHGRGLCFVHYRRWYVHGDPSITLHAAAGAGSIRRDGYRLVSRDGKQVREHRLIMEKRLGRKLLTTEIVHHKNGRADNRPEQLEVLPNQRAHVLLHAKYFRSDTHKECSRCRQVLPRDAFSPRHCKGRDRNHSRCRNCSAIVMRERRATHQEVSGRTGTKDDSKSKDAV